MDTKQVIIMRKFPNLRTGKYCAQAAHASMSFLTKYGNVYHPNHCHEEAEFAIDLVGDFWEEVEHWLNDSFKKIVCYVNTEEELDELYQKALDNGLIAHMITDNGTTEFNGVPTKTAIAIGPHWDSKFEGITDHLPLL